MLAFAVVLLVAVGVSDSVILTDCQLKPLFHTHLNVPSMPDLAAKLACHIKMTSNFNTSAVNTINLSETTGKGHNVEKNEPNATEVWTMYGLFQLSDHVACVSTNIPTLNMCNLNCTKLIDNDITDDLACVKTIVTKRYIDKTEDHHDMIRLLKSKECAGALGFQYFSHCKV